jgi:hypothetical protein
MRPSLSIVAACASALAAACTASGGGERAPAKAAEPAANPAQAEVSLPAAHGWRASLVLDQSEKNGVWTVGVLDVFPQFGCPDIAALDDQGRFHALWSYSGKWTPATAVYDGKWLGGLVQADLDPRVPGTEIYVGSQNGNVWQVTAHLETFLDARLVAQLIGREVHTLVGGELDAAHPGGELYAFTRPGALFRLSARTDGLDGFEVAQLGDLAGRVRDALILPPRAGAAPEIATAGRHGRVEILSFPAGQPEWTTVHEVPMGVGRLASKPGSTADALVLYSVCDDGRVYRHARDTGRWATELIYAGPQGMRGCAAGRFDADASVETLAVFGYSREVELLSRRDGTWSVETIFVDRDKGHWLCAGELDGRNSTEEIVSSGYSGRVVLLARPPGYGLSGVLASKD